MASAALTSIKWQVIRLFSLVESREFVPGARTAADLLTPATDVV